MYPSFVFSLSPLLANASSYSGFAASKSSLEQERLFSILLMIAGICLIMVGNETRITDNERRQLTIYYAKIAEICFRMIVASR